MVLLAKAGTFTKGDGNSITTPGFRPAAVFFWTPNATAENTWSTQLDLGYGILANTPSGVRQQAMWLFATNGVNTSNAQAGLNPQKSIAVKSWTMTATPQALGFDVSWASSPPSNTRVHYLALGGDTQADILTQTFPATLQAGQIVQVRGALFQPSSIIALAQRDVSGSDKTLGLGVADDAGGQWASGATSQDGVNPPNTARIWREDAVIALCDSNGAARFVAKVVQMQPNGFDLQVISAPTATVTVYFLCLRGMMARATAQGKTTAAAPATGTVTAGFRPLVELFASTYQTAAGGGTQNRGMVGASDGTNQAVGAWSDQDALTPSVAKGISRTTNALVKADNGTPTIEAAATAAMNAAGATLTWNPNDAVAMRFGTLSFGTLSAALGGLSSTETGLLADQFYQPVLLFGTSTTDDDLSGAIGPVALLSGTPSTETDIPTALLRTDTTIRGATSSTATDLSAHLALRAILGGVSSTDPAIDCFAFGKGQSWNDIFTTTTETDATTTGIGIGRKFFGTLTTETEALGYLLLPLPVLNAAGPNDVAGTVNWHPNPSAEGSLIGWDAFGGASVALDNLDAWMGTNSVKVTTPGTAAGEGVLVRGSAGLQLTGKARTVWSQVRCKGPAGTVLTVYSEILYVDGTTVVGDSAQVTLTGNWDLLYAPAVVTIPTAILLQAEMAVVTTTPQALTFRVDGAQLEEDHGDGPTRLAIGGISDDIGIWTGTANRSLSIREPAPRETRAPGRGGPWTIEATLYRATWDNQWIEDISDAILSGTVTMDTGRDQVWTFDATLTLPGWRRLTPFLDWVAPYLKVTAPDGTVREGQLGLYFVVDSPETRSEVGGTVKLQCGDPLWLMSKQGFIGSLVARAGVEKMHAARDIVNSAVLTGEGAQPTMDKRYAIPDSAKKFKKDREWPRKTTKLSAANDICRSAGFYPLYTTGTGIILTRQMGGDKEKRLRHRQPVREWIANVPPGWTADDGWIPRVYDAPSELVGTIDTTPKMADMDNEIWLINDDPDDNKIFVKHKIRNRNNKRSFFIDAGRHKQRKLYAPYMDDTATAQEVADALADELSTFNSTISFSVLPDPSVALMHEVVNLAFFDADGDGIAGGRYAVHRVTYGFTPNDCLMKIDAGFVENADDLVEQDDAA